MKSNLQFCFTKDLSGKFTSMNDNFAEAANFDSPGQGIGKMDSDTVWHKHADLFRQGDFKILNGQPQINEEEEISFDNSSENIRQILTTKSALQDKNDNIIGVIGTFIDLSCCNIVKKQAYFNPKTRRYTILGKGFDISITLKQSVILKYMILGYSSSQIGLLTHRSKRTIEGHIESLKSQFQCTSRAEVIRWAIKSGIFYALS